MGQQYPPQQAPDYGDRYEEGAAYDGEVEGQYAPAPPPMPRYAYQRPPMPGPGHYWVDGYWNFRGGRYGWVNGYWMMPPYAGSYWVAPRYNNGRFFVGFWGGANRGYARGYRPGYGGNVVIQGGGRGYGNRGYDRGYGYSQGREN